eukprot:gnl/TRDRNA2_/TRDRNA2_167890_c0_seq1.p1 gnl/TRDRNA2_/TRDRNA2_167890_c0~~gnl/TRDRNA2_/TRDRNA2_167890_c0_seq1.p1  ORF type:complete len:510 (+),score=45.08 gnl/TRDRNA2_/TRDRNA2_167890_c0_seq1:109-1638(+)
MAKHFLPIWWVFVVSQWSKLIFASATQFIFPLPYPPYQFWVADTRDIRRICFDLRSIYQQEFSNCAHMLRTIARKEAQYTSVNVSAELPSSHACTDGKDGVVFLDGHIVGCDDARALNCDGGREAACGIGFQVCDGPDQLERLGLEYTSCLRRAAKKSLYVSKTPSLALWKYHHNHACSVSLTDSPRMTEDQVEESRTCGVLCCKAPLTQRRVPLADEGLFVTHRRYCEAEFVKYEMDSYGALLDRLQILADSHAASTGMPVEGNTWVHQGSPFHATEEQAAHRQALLTALSFSAALRPSLRSDHSTEAPLLIQIGFNAGHSAAMMLWQFPNAIVHSFDLCEHPYVAEAHEFLVRFFGGRHELTCGRSRITLSGFALQRNRSQPIAAVFVDGAHLYSEVLIDIMNAAALAGPKPGRVLIILDDCAQVLPREAGQSGFRTAGLPSQAMLGKSVNPMLAHVSLAWQHSVAAGIVAPLLGPADARGDMATHRLFSGRGQLCVGTAAMPPSAS